MSGARDRGEATERPHRRPEVTGRSAGDLDANVGYGGRTWGGPACSGPAGGAGLAIDDDGGLLVASWGVASAQDFSLTRLSVSGGYAPTAWTVTGDFAGATDYVYGVALRADGSAMVVGESGGDFATMRVKQPSGLEQRHYALQDANFNVTAIADVFGQVVERYELTPYGKFAVLNPDWTVDADGSDFGWVHVHQGGRYDANVGGYEFRHRWLSVELGRWMQQDPAGYADGPNAYQYVSSGPADYRDALGLWGGGKRRFRDEAPLRKKRIAVLQAKKRRLEARLQFEANWRPAVNWGVEPDPAETTRLTRAEISMIQAEILMIMQEPEPTLGHSDFSGADEFDYNAEDDDPATSPLGPLGIIGANHFRDLLTSTVDVFDAIGACDKDKFQRAVHRGQDYYSHYRPGFRQWGGPGVVGHAWAGHDPDDADKHRAAWDEAEEWTKRMLEHWNASCCKGADGKWMRKPVELPPDTRDPKREAFYQQNPGFVWQDVSRIIGSLGR